MPDFQSLIKMLENDNPNKRYEACEELRVSRQPLPQEAIYALNLATNDSNPDVADAAQRALALHNQDSNEPVLEQEQSKAMTNGQAVGIGIVTGSLLYAIIGYYQYGPYIILTFFYFCWPAILFSIAGALVGKSWKRTRLATWAGALLGAIFGIVVDNQFQLMYWFWSLIYGGGFNFD